MNRDSLRSLLRNRDFLLMQFGLSVSRIGTFMQEVAVNWQLYQLTKSPLSLGILGLSKFFPVLIMSFFSGIVADSYNRKKIIFIVQVFSILNAGLLAILTITGKITPILIYVLVGLEAGLYSFETPARQAIGPTIIEKKDFPLAVNIMNIFYQSTNFIGPALAGFVIAFYGVKTVYVINTVSFLAVIIALIMMRPLPHIDHKPEFNLKEIFTGFRYVFQTPLIKSSMFLDFFATFFASASTLMPIFAVDILKVGPREMGFLYAAPAVGAILAGLVFPFVSHNKNKGKILIYAIIFYGVNTFLFAISKNFYLSLIFIALSGSGDMISAILRNVIRQMTTPDRLRGRMTAVIVTFYTAGPQLGEIEVGFAAYLMGTPLSVAFGGIATIVATIYIAIKTPQLLNYKDNDQ